MSDDEACLLKSPNRLLKRRSPAGFGYNLFCFAITACRHRSCHLNRHGNTSAYAAHLRHINATSLVRRKHAHGVLPQVLRQLSTKND
jgi:hypothetical protein